MSKQDELDCILKQEIEALEENVKKIDKMLELLNLKCDKIITKVVEIDNKTYEIVDKMKNKTHNATQCSEWDYYDLDPSNVSFN